MVFCCFRPVVVSSSFLSCQGSLEGSRKVVDKKLIWGREKVALNDRLKTPEPVWWNIWGVSVSAVDMKT